MTPCSRLRSWCLAVAALVAPAQATEFVFLEPSDDRWHYPYNFTPGTRQVAGCFGSFGNPDYPEFNDRDGIFIVAWDTSAQIPAGQPAAQYDVCEVEVTLTNDAGANWHVDRTVDAWQSYVNPQLDDDPGRPIELFGAAFGPRFIEEGWRENSPFEGGSCDLFGMNCVNRPRDPYPFVFQDQTLTRLHVEDSVKGFHNQNLAVPLCADPQGICPFTPQPWAIGDPVGYTRGNQPVPFPVLFEVDLSLSGGAVRGYFQEQLSRGRVLVIVTSLLLVGEQEVGTEYPNFLTRDAPEDAAPRLRLRLAPEVSGDDTGDGQFDAADLPALLDCLSGPGMDPAPTAPRRAAACRCVFDTDGDGDVDLRDFSRLGRS